MQDATIICLTDRPDYLDLAEITYEWEEEAVYDDINNEMPYNDPIPLGKPVILDHYVDATISMTQS